MLERAGHQRDVAGARDGRVRHHRVRAHLHGLGGLAGTPDARVDDHRHVRVRDDNLDEVAHAQSLVGADKRAERHHAGGAGLLKPLGRDRIGEHVRHHHEALLGEHLGGANRLLVVGQQVLRLVLDLDLDEVRLADLAGETRNAHGLLRVTRAGRVRQHRDALGDVVEQVVLGRAAATQRHRHDLCAGVLYGRLDEVQVVAPRAEDEAAGELVPAEHQRVGVAGRDVVVGVRVRFGEQRGVRRRADEFVEHRVVRLGGRCG